jgi:hypothetical protein
VAADWPGQPETDPVKRTPGRLAPDGLLPHVHGDIYVHGTAEPEDDDPGVLILDGLLLEGQVRVLIGEMGEVALHSCTIAPNGEAIHVNGGNERLTLRVDRTICGRIKVVGHTRRLCLEDSIVSCKDQEGTDAAISAPDTLLDTKACTILGDSTVRSLEATDSIFAGLLTVERTQSGCVRFSYVGGSRVIPSRTPRKYRCQPDLAIRAAGKPTPSEEDLIRLEMAPAFTSTAYGRGGFAQLVQTCAEGIRKGAESGSEMGAFSHLMQPQREANLRTVLSEYLPFGMEIALDFEN